MRLRTNSHVTKETKKQIVKEYLTGNLSQRELCIKYNLNQPNNIANWVRRFNKKENSLSLQPEPEKNNSVMANKSECSRTPEELEELLRQKDAELQMKNMQIEALNKLIDIAERNGISVRKNSGAKR